MTGRAAVSYILMSVHMIIVLEIEIEFEKSIAGSISIRPDNIIIIISSIGNFEGSILDSISVLVLVFIRESLYVPPAILSSTPSQIDIDLAVRPY